MARRRSDKIRAVLVAGASGQLGRELSRQLVDVGYRVRALIHKTPLDVPGVECVRGNVSDLASVLKAVKGVEAVCQLATTKEDPATFLDVSVRGTWNLLEAAWQTGTVRRWILAGRDCAMGIYYYPQRGPITETMPHRAYPGCYALSKVLEEVLGQQYHIQGGIPYVCLRSSWILHGDMILCHLSAANWTRRLTARQKAAMKKREHIAVLMHPDGRPLLCHVVALANVASAFPLALDNPAAVGQAFNIAAPGPFA